MEVYSGAIMIAKYKFQINNSLANVLLNTFAYMAHKHQNKIIQRIANITILITIIT